MQHFGELFPGNITVLAVAVEVAKGEQVGGSGAWDFGKEVGGFAGGRKGNGAGLATDPEAAHWANFYVTLMYPSLMLGLELIQQFGSIRWVCGLIKIRLGVAGFTNKQNMF